MLICPRLTINNFVNPPQIHILLIVGGGGKVRSADPHFVDLGRGKVIDNQQFCQSTLDPHFVDPPQIRSTFNNFVNPHQIHILQGSGMD